MQFHLLNDLGILLNNMKIEQDPLKFYSYVKLKKNIIFTNDENKIIMNEKESILKEQSERDIIVNNELKKLDDFGIPFIGLKGPFIKNKYYGTIPRVYNDLDLLVKSNDAQSFYYNLKNLGYHVKAKTMYDNPIINMEIMPKKYMENTQTLMLRNKYNGISIDMHCNLNITNAHFKKTNVQFSTDELFSDSIKFENYKNIRQLKLNENICFVIRHLLKHHIFYGKTQTGLRTVLQQLMDLAVLINSANFDEKALEEKVVEYNIIPETIYCALLYNNIFLSGQEMNISRYFDLFNSNNIKCNWYKIIEISKQMDITDIVIGNYMKYSPKLYNAVEFCQNVPNKNIGWAIQALIINPLVIKGLI